MFRNHSVAMIGLLFMFDNHDACEAEREAWIEAELYAQTPKALGWERGQAVPQSAIVKQGKAEGPFKFATVEPVAGLYEVELEYTDKLGVCTVIGVERFTSGESREFQLDQLDLWAERVATKFGGVAGTKSPVADGYTWRGANLPEGYDSVGVALAVDPAEVMLIFRFDNHHACDAEQEAWTQAEL